MEEKSRHAVGETDFVSKFRAATGEDPFDFQKRFALNLPSLVNVPTGLGKTAMAVIGWAWRRRFADVAVQRATPRRLVYCLPMRVLVEQTRDNVVLWLQKLGLLSGSAHFEEGSNKKRLAYKLNMDDAKKIAVHILMGGEDTEKWDLYPERDAILIGTQDMLLSRALNRGYAASRARWPMQFGLLHTDCLWVFDEIQLMGSGLATTAQLEAFRRLLGAKDGNGCRSVWMSATLRPDWLKTVDFMHRFDAGDRIDGRETLTLTEEDHKGEQVVQRWNASKPLAKSKANIGQLADLANEIVTVHQAAKGRTIAVVNTVKRACELRAEINRQWPTATDENLILIHSRFRPDDRAARVERLMAGTPPEKLSPEGMIVVSTQVIEAGVDVSATTLFTELAPWASLVQRFGRCNRRGKENESASVRWVDVPEKEPTPYGTADLVAARERLKNFKDVGPKSLPAVELPFEHTHVVRRKDLIDLFDTTPDLAGNDIDIDRYVRDVEDSDVRVFWRHYGDPHKGATPNRAGGGEFDNGAARLQPLPRREELCSAPIGSDKNPGFRAFAKKHGGKIWRWNFLDGKWEKADSDRVVPGQIYLVHSNAGGYTPDRGWDGKSTDEVAPISPPDDGKEQLTDANDDDAQSRIGVWQTIADHTSDVCRELDAIMAELPSLEGDAGVVRAAARWHDLGKAHKVFQGAIDGGQTIERKGKPLTRRQRPEAFHGCRVVAKAPGKRYTHGKLVDPGWWRRYDWPNDGRKHFRHELASALAVLQRPHGDLIRLSENDLNLAAYLIAAHHGKVRLSIRSMPGEKNPGDGQRFARGTWDGDELPETDLGGGVRAPAVKLSLEPMELGLCELPPFAGQPSWIERMLRLRDSFGPFRLAFLETILRAADMRASAAAGKAVAVA